MPNELRKKIDKILDDHNTKIKPEGWNCSCGDKVMKLFLKMLVDIENEFTGDPKEPKWYIPPEFLKRIKIVLEDYKKMLKK